MSDQHTYRCKLAWRGSTAAGYEDYNRTHRVVVPPASGHIELSSDPAFLGNAELPNPEQLLVAAASSCQLLSFLARAARSRIDVHAYEDEAEAVMPADSKPMRITRIVLRPRIRVAPGADRDRIARLVESAHRGCFIANTLNAEIVLEPVISIDEDG